MNRTTNLASHRIGIMGGDGVGPELVTQALRVLRRVSELYDVEYELTEYPHSADHYLDTGVLLDEETITEIGGLDAMLFGAAGDPRLPEGTMEQGLLLRLVSRLDLGIGVRPGRLYTAGLSPLKDLGAGEIDIVIVRDTTEDAFAVQAGSHRQGGDDEVAIGLLIYTRSAVERVTRYAFEEARRRTGKISLVHQANAVRAHELLPRVATEVGEEFPDVTLEELYPDAAAMLMVSDPRRLDVVLTTYWIGGILSDLLGAIIGGIGLVGSARLNLDRQFGLFEPAHGSAPKYAGMGVVSPMATHLALAMMLRHLGETEAAAAIERAVEDVLRSGRVPGVSTRSGVGTAAATDEVLGALDNTAFVTPPQTEES